MNYIVEFWCVQASGEEFRGRLDSQSPKPTNWLPKMRRKFGSQCNFDEVTNFEYLARPEKDILAAEKSNSQRK